MARVTIPSGRITMTGDRIEIDGVGPVVAMRPNRLSDGGFSIAPAKALDPTAPEDLYLISTHEPRRDHEPSDALPVAELRASLRRVLGADLPFSEAIAIRSTVGNSRQVDSYRVGRVFLAGDAAHIFNAGGSALNVGLQDAVDLARILTAAIRDGRDSELDQYENLRRPAGALALQHTRAQAALSRDGEDASAIRDIMATTLKRRSASRRLARLIENAPTRRAKPPAKRPADR